MNVLPRTTPIGASVSVVMLVEQDIPASDLLERFAEVLLLYFTDVEFVIVGNGVADDVARSLAATVNATPDSAALFMAQRVDPDVARLIGMENAVSDYVLLTTPNDAELSVLATLLDSYVPGNEVLIGQGNRPPRGKPVYRILQNLFYRLYDRINGTKVEPRPAPLRLYSRAACMHPSIASMGRCC